VGGAHFALHPSAHGAVRGGSKLALRSHTMPCLEVRVGGLHAAVVGTSGEKIAYTEAHYTPQCGAQTAGKRKGPICLLCIKVGHEPTDKPPQSSQVKPSVVVDPVALRWVPRKIVQKNVH